MTKLETNAKVNAKEYPPTLVAPKDRKSRRDRVVRMEGFIEDRIELRLANTQYNHHNQRGKYWLYYKYHTRFEG